MFGNIYSSPSADGSARQHNGNVYNTNTNYYSQPEQPYDKTLGVIQRNREMLRAAAEGQTQRVEILISKYGADIDYSDDDGMTALHHASLSGFADTVHCLLFNHGADVNAVSRTFGTPVCLAAMKARADVFYILLKARARLDAPAGCFGSVLHAAAIGADSSLLKVLIEDHRLDPELRGTVKVDTTHSSSIMQELATTLKCAKPTELRKLRDCSVVHLASLLGNLELLALMVDTYGASTTCSTRATRRYCNSKNVRSFSDEQDVHPLNLASDEACLNKLIDRGADMNHCTSQGLTAAMKFADNGDSMCLQTLIARGAYLDIQDSAGWTALHHAADQGHMECVHQLCGLYDTDWSSEDYYGTLSIRVTAKTHANNTPLSLAKARGHTECINMLLAYEAWILDFTRRPRRT